MDKPTRKAMADALLAAVRSGATDSTLPGGSSMHIAREATASSPAFIETTGPAGETMRFNQFPAGDLRPLHYPAELPFVPDAPVSIGSHDGAPVMFWWGVPDPERVVEELLRQSAESGWSQGEPLDAPVPFAMRMLQLRRGSAHRMIMSISSPAAMVSLLDQDPAHEDPAVDGAP